MKLIRQAKSLSNFVKNVKTTDLSSSDLSKMAQENYEFYKNDPEFKV